VKETTYAQVRDYLNQLTELKKKIEPPISLEIDDNLYKLYDGLGKPAVILSKAVYEIFNEL